MNSLKTAVLLLGPTGSGKTPLGEFLERHGFRGKHCFHFDFGEHLRAAAEGRELVKALTDADLEFIGRVLRTGALLEGDTFHIARKIFRHFVETRRMGAADIVLLNGLPRHAGQADDMDSEVRVELVVCLHCSPEVVSARIRLNSGGDRSARADDTAELVAGKLRIFAKRTMPLVEHYRAKAARILDVEVGVETAPGDILKIM